MKPFSKETKFNKERLTNHSARKADKIAMSHITQLSDHRNVQRMTNCSRVNLEQQREVLNIVSRSGSAALHSQTSALPSAKAKTLGSTQASTVTTSSGAADGMPVKLFEGAAIHGV